MPFQFSYGKLSFEEVRTFLLETDGEFPTPLSAHVDIDAYAKKLSDFSDFAICRDGKTLVGMISCYTNRPPMGYISNACVKRTYQGQKVFSRMFLLLMDKLKEQDISCLLLEVDVNNVGARRVYERYGFREIEFRPDSHKSLMEYRFG